MSGKLADGPAAARAAARESALGELRRIESLDRGALEAWQLEQLNEQLAHCFDRSPFYRTRRERDGLPERVGQLADLAAFPFTTKQDLRDGYPLGFLAADWSEVIRYGESTGTTGPPSSAFITYPEWIRGNVWVEEALGHHFGPGDLVCVAIPYELAFASYDLDRALEGVGAAVLATGTLSGVCPAERMADIVWAIRPTGLVCSPTRALRLYDLLADAGRDPREVGVRTIVYVGETCAPTRLAKLRERWGAELTTAYGSTETNSLALECRDGASHLTEDRHLFELVDPASGVPAPPGEPGELVVTSLGARAMPLLRYRTGDLVELDGWPCSCGSPRRVIRHLGRVSDHITVAGRTLRTIAVEQVVLGTSGTGVYYAAAERGGALAVRVEVRGGDAEATCADVSARVRAALDVPCSTAPIDHRAVATAMDGMLKPGGLTLAALEAAT